MSTETSSKTVFISAQRLADLRARSEALQRTKAKKHAKQLSMTNPDQESSKDETVPVPLTNDQPEATTHESQILDPSEYSIVPSRWTLAPNNSRHNTHIPLPNNRDPAGNLIANEMYWISGSESSDDDGDSSDLLDPIARFSTRLGYTGNTQNTMLNFPSTADEPDSVRVSSQHEANFNKRSSRRTFRKRISILHEKYRRETIIKDVQPAIHFNNTADLKFLGAQLLDTDGHPPFMNNIAAASTHYPMFFLADKSGIRVYANDAPSGILEDSSLLYISTEPEVTTEAMREAAVYPTDPHNITRLLTGTIENNEEVLVASCDSGRVVVYKTSTIYTKFCAALQLAQQNKKTPDTRGTVVLKNYQPDAVCQLPMSAWGLDIHPTKSLLAVACNEGRVYVHDLLGVFRDKSKDPDPTAFLISISPQLPHNVPDVKFIIPDEEDASKGFYTENTFYVMCCSISGHVAMWEFYIGDLLNEYLAGLNIPRPDLILNHDVNNLSKLVAEERSNISSLQQQQNNEATNKRPSSGSSSRRRSMASNGRQRQSRSSDFYFHHNEVVSLTDLLEDERFISPLQVYEEINEEDDTMNFSAFEADASEKLTSYRWLFKDEKDDPWFLRIPFGSGRWILVEQIRQDGWSINTLSDEDFLPVESLYEVSGNKWFNEANIFKQQSSSMHRQYIIPGLNREEASFGNYTVDADLQKQRSSSVSSGMSTSSNSKRFGEVIPLNQQFIDFTMRFSFFVIYTVPVIKFDQSWKYKPPVYERRGSASSSLTSLSSRDSFSLSVNPIGVSNNDMSGTTAITGIGGRTPSHRASQAAEAGMRYPTSFESPRSRPGSQGQNPSIPALNSNDGATNSVGDEDVIQEDNEEVEESEVEDFSMSQTPSNTQLNRGIGTGAADSFEMYTGTSAHHLSTYLDVIRGNQRDAYIYKRTQHPQASEYTHQLLRDPPLKNKFVFLTSTKSVHLCRAESLIGNASQGDIFECASYLDRASASFDRLSIVTKLPGLHAIAVASQLGAVSIFRLVKHKTVYSVRQEYVVPVHEMFVHRRHTRRAITGLAAVPVYGAAQNPKTVDQRLVKKYRLIITYLDGLIFVYELTDVDGVLRMATSRN